MVRYEWRNRRNRSGIRSLNKEGYREKFEPLRIIDESRAALVSMPEGSFGVVLGSGDNTAGWREKGWLTLDIDPESGADYVHDANHLEGFFPPESLDYLHAECITFDKEGKEGIHTIRLLNQANKVLKPHGRLIITTANVEGKDTPVPDRREFAKKMTKLGFRTVTELHGLHDVSDGVKDQRVIYYGEKLGSGHDPSRLG